MKGRIARYSKPIKDQEKILKFKNGDNKEEVAVLDKKYFDKDRDKDKIVGYVHQTNKEYSGKEYATLKGATKDNLDIYSKKKFYRNVVGYINTKDGEFLAVTSNRGLIILLLIGLLIIGIGAFIFFNSTRPTAPDFSEVAEEDSEYDIKAKVVLPQGDVTFNGTVYTPEDEKKEKKEDPYSGEATIRVTIVVDGVEHLLVDTTKVQISKGKLPDITIDFTKLDFELKPGTYVGVVHIVYADGSEIDKPIEIVIYDSSSGNADLGFSERINVDKSTGKISLKLEYNNASTDAIVQVIVIRNGREVLLGQSGIVKNGQTITELALEQAAGSMIEAGAYEGIMRIYFDDTGANETTDLKTDIECKIYVQ